MVTVFFVNLCEISSCILVTIFSKNVKVISSYNQEKCLSEHICFKFIHSYNLNSENTVYQHFPMEASYCQPCAATLNSLLTHCRLSETQTDMQYSTGISDTQTHTLTYRKSLTPICTVRFTLRDYRNRLLPMCRQEGSFSV